MRRANALVSSFCLILLAAWATSASPKEDLQLDAFGDVSWEDMKARLDWYASEMDNRPGAVAYILLYGGKVTGRGEIRERIACLRGYLVKRRGVSGRRLKFIRAGYREEFSGEVWVLPAGHQAPVASPSVARKEVKFLGRGANVWRNSCGASSGSRIAPRATSNNGMHPTRDTPALIYLYLVGGRVMPGVRLLRGYEG